MPTLRLLFLSLFVLGAAEQPIPYSHKKHVALGLECSGCHTMPGKGEAATFPAESICMQCHVAVKKDSVAIQKLAEYVKAKKPVPWVRVYKLPDYVWFSHKIHGKAAACGKCHGDVGAREVMVKEKPMNMNSCMNCHDEHKASNECNLCHNPA
ncbi:MAG: cytochrome c3 family protein [Bryobacteraceae bacterium]